MASNPSTSRISSPAIMNGTRNSQQRRPPTTPVLVYPKEEPNTKDIQVWSNAVLDELDKEILQQERGKKRSSREHVVDSVEDDEDSSTQLGGLLKLQYLQYLESIAFYVISIGAWIFVMLYTLDYLRFPIHKHKVLVGCMYIIPILSIIVLLRCIDYSYTLTRKKNS